MRKKKPVPLYQKFPNADPLALRVLERMLAFDPKDRPTAEEVDFHPSAVYFPHIIFGFNSKCCGLFLGSSGSIF